MLNMLGRRRVRTFLFSVVLLCAVTFIASPFLHNVIPHDHNSSDSHGQMQDSSIWQDLHSTLQHEKKSFALLTETFVLLIFSLSVYVAVFILSVQHTALLYDPVSGKALRKGIVPHRMFR